MIIAFSFVDVTSVRGTRLSSPFIMELEVPKFAAPIMKKDFCWNCRKILSNHGGYVIADLYVPGESVVYDLCDGMQMNLRCYSIRANFNAVGNEYKLTI